MRILYSVDRYYMLIYSLCENGPLTVEEIAKAAGITTSRVRQIHNRIKDELANNITATSYDLLSKRARNVIEAIAEIELQKKRDTLEVMNGITTDDVVKHCLLVVQSSGVTPPKYIIKFRNCGKHTAKEICEYFGWPCDF